MSALARKSFARAIAAFLTVMLVASLAQATGQDHSAPARAAVRAAHEPAPPTQKLKLRPLFHFATTKTATLRDRPLFKGFRNHPSWAEAAYPTFSRPPSQEEVAHVIGALPPDRGNGPVRIMDAAAGNGQLAVAVKRRLNEAGRKGIVIANEYDPHHREGARGTREVVKESDVDVNVTGFSWSDLKKSGLEPMDVMIATGNSLAYGTPQEQEESLRAMVAMVKPGGKLLIDTRRYELLERFRGAAFNDAEMLRVLNPEDSHYDTRNVTVVPRTIGKPGERTTFHYYNSLNGTQSKLSYSFRREPEWVDMFRRHGLKVEAKTYDGKLAASPAAGPSNPDTLFVGWVLTKER